MSSEMGQVIDDMLSGLQAIQRQTAALRMPEVESPAESAVRTSSIRPFGDDDSLTMLMLAVLESQQEHPCAASARRWLVDQFNQRAVPLGELGGRRYAQTRVSPRMLTALGIVAAHGAVLEECDAHSTHWFWPGGDLDSASRAFGRLFLAVCLEQNTEGMRFRAPKIPERIVLRFSINEQSTSSVGELNAGGFAGVDQDNALGQPSTVLWLDEGGFVPDYFCAITHRAGRWWPIVRTSRD